jgi:DNA-binding IscR family transcriptional regulator
VLIGLQAAYTLQHFQRLMASDGTGTRSGPRIVDPAVVVAVAGALVRSHRAGKSPDAGELSGQLNIDAEVVQSLLQRLEEAGLVRRVLIDGDEEAGWVPARPAETIEVDELLATVVDLDACKATPECSGLLHELTAARRSAARGKNLGDAVTAAGPA